MKIGETVKVRLDGGKVVKGVITDFVPDLFTHTLVAVRVGKAEIVIDEKGIVRDEKTAHRH